MPKREEIYRKLQLLIMKGVVEEAEQYFVIKEEAKPWYPAILVDLIPEKREKIMIKPWSLCKRVRLVRVD